MVWVVGGEYKWEDLEGFLRLSTAQGYFSQAGRNPTHPLLTGPCALVEKQGRTKEVPFSMGTNTPCGLAVVPQTLLGQVLEFTENH